MNLSLSYSQSDAQHAVTSRVFDRVEFDRRTGARGKLLAPMSLTKRLAVPLVGRQPAQYLPALRCSFGRRTLAGLFTLPLVWRRRESGRF